MRARWPRSCSATATRRSAFATIPCSVCWRTAWTGASKKCTITAARCPTGPTSPTRRPRRVGRATQYLSRALRRVASPIQEALARNPLLLRIAMNPLIARMWQQSFRLKGNTRPTLARHGRLPARAPAPGRGAPLVYLYQPYGNPPALPVAQALCPQIRALFPAGPPSTGLYQGL